jgi:hypothetical protein
MFLAVVSTGYELIHSQDVDGWMDGWMDGWIDGRVEAKERDSISGRSKRFFMIGIVLGRCTL